jgi:hypothetical protein
VPLGLTITVGGEATVADALGRELSGMSSASVKAQKYATNNTKARLRQATAGPLGPRVANAWRDEQYPNAQGLGVDSRGMVWTRAPNIIASAEDAPLIRAREGVYLAVPTAAAGVGPGGRRITPNEFKKRTGIPLRPVRTKRGNLLLVAQEQSRRFKRGPGGRLVGRQRGGGFATKNFIRGKDFVVVFILVRQVQMRKLLDRTPIADQGAEELAEFLSALLNAA